jgi:hypothetical protein
MIYAKNLSSDPNLNRVESSVSGSIRDILVEAMSVNAEIVKLSRQKGIKDEDIEKQLTINIVQGFKLADYEKEAKNE